MTLKVRPMNISDIDGVYAIEVVGHRTPWSRNILHDCVMVHYDCFVIEVVSKNEVVLAGYMISRIQEKSSHVLNVCIAPALQGKGYGQVLLKNRLDSMTSAAIETVLLEVRPSNSIALHIYQKMGFQPTGTKRGYYRDGESIEDAVVLQKKLIIEPME